MNDRATAVNSRAVSVIVGPTVIHPDDIQVSHQKPAYAGVASSASITTEELLREFAQKPYVRGDKLHTNQTNKSSSLEHGANRMSYPREFKLLVISYYFQHGQNKYRTCKEFQITKSMLNGWLQKVDKIQQSRPGSLKSGRSGRKPQFPTVEKQLYHVYQACLNAGKKVGNRWLRDTAKLIAQRQCTQEELSGMCQFSERWLCNFKKRYNINLTKDWNGEVINSGHSTNVHIKQSSDGHSCNSPTPETGSNSPTCEADSSTSPKKCETPPQVTYDDNVNVGEDEEKPLEIYVKPTSPSNVVDDEEEDLKVDDELQTSPTVADATRGVYIPSSINSTTVISVNSTCPPTMSAKYQPYEPGRRGRKVQFPQVEEILYKNLCLKQTGGVRVSNRWLQDEARRLAVELCPEMFTNAFKSARCMFSEHWLHNFKKRYGISLKHQQHQSQQSNNANNIISHYESRISAATSTSTDNTVGRSSSALSAYLTMKQQQQQHQQRASSSATTTTTATSPFLWDFRNSLALAAAAAATAGQIYDHQQQQSSDFAAGSRLAGGATAPSTQTKGAEDLPTMVPLTTSFDHQSLTKIDLAEWYSKISNTTNVNQCLQLFTDEVRLRQATTTVSTETAKNNGEYER